MNKNAFLLILIIILLENLEEDLLLIIALYHKKIIMSHKVDILWVIAQLKEMGDMEQN